MTTPAPIDPQTPSNQNPAPGGTTVPVGPSFEDTLRDFWAKHSKTVIAACVVVLLAILGRGAFEYYQREKEAGIRSEYAAATTPEKIKSFINQYPEHALSGAGALTLGDDAYQANNYAEAASQYQRAVDILKTGPLFARARLGLAMSKVAQGQTADGEEKLKQLSNDLGTLKSIRAEAAYHLAVLAIEGGRTDEAIKHLESASSSGQAGVWAQRAMMLRATLPAPATQATDSSTPSVSIKPSTP